jgi:hypothetical protein
MVSKTPKRTIETAKRFKAIPPFLKDEKNPGPTESPIA